MSSNCKICLVMCNIILRKYIGSFSIRKSGSIVSLLGHKFKVNELKVWKIAKDIRTGGYNEKRKGNCCFKSWYVGKLEKEIN